MSNEQQSGNTPNKSDKKKPVKRPLKPEEEGFKFNFFWIYAIVIAVLIMGFLSNFSDVTKPISAADFKDMLTNNEVMAVKVVGHKNAMVYLNDSALLQSKYSEVAKSRFGSVNRGPHFSFTVASNDAFDKMMTEYYKERPDQAEVEIVYEEGKDWGNLIGWLLPLIIIVGLWVMMMRRMGGGGGMGGGGNIFNIGRSKAILFDKDEKVNITFGDVAGLDEAKVEVQEIVSFLKEPQKYTRLGGKIPKGVLLVGPP